MSSNWERKEAQEEAEYSSQLSKQGEREYYSGADDPLAWYLQGRIWVAIASAVVMLLLALALRFCAAVLNATHPKVSGANTSPGLAGGASDSAQRGVEHQEAEP